MPKLIRILTLTVTLTLCSCAASESSHSPIPPDNPEAGPWYWLGATGLKGSDRIQQLLFRNGILAGTEGSVVYAVCVRESFVERSLRLISGIEGIYWDPEDPPRRCRQ
jgi:hypothetical protein